MLVKNAPRVILTKAFFERPAPLVARELIGKYIVRSVGGKKTAAMITEAEAYEGFDDLASHASRGMTPRNKVMFGEAGVLYVYFVYGMHMMLNVVTGKRGYPAAVLIRGTDLVTGPGRLTKFFNIGLQFTGKKALPQNTLWFEDRGTRPAPREIKRTPRIGVDYAGPIWSQKKYRFIYTPIK